MTTIAQERYSEGYLRSPRWRVLRWLRRRMDGNRCRLCGSSRRLEVHHRSYEHKGERGIMGMVRELRDLTTLCHADHGRYHGKL